MNSKKAKRSYFCTVGPLFLMLLSLLMPSSLSLPLSLSLLKLREVYAHSTILCEHNYIFQRCNNKQMLPSNSKTVCIHGCCPHYRNEISMSVALLTAWAVLSVLEHAVLSTRPDRISVTNAVYGLHAEVLPHSILSVGTFEVQSI